MAEQQHQPANELERLSAASAQTCLRAIRSQIAIGYTFCNLAKSQLQTGRTGNARRVVEKLRLLRAGVATQPANLLPCIRNHHLQLGCMWNDAK